MSCTDWRLALPACKGVPRLQVVSRPTPAGGGDLPALHAELSDEKAAADELRSKIADAEALGVLKTTLAEEKAAAVALRAKMGEQDVSG